MMPSTTRSKVDTDEFNQDAVRGYWRHTHPWALHSRPEVVTLCGSTRFVEEFNKARQWLTLKGQIVLSIEIVTTQQYEEDPQHTNRSNKAMLDLLHLHKIHLSDYIFVINKDGYIGESTANEIEYARTLGKPIEYLESLS